MKEEGDTTTHNILNAPPPMRWTIVNDESTISSSLTMNNRMDAVEINMIITNTHISNLDNSVNYMSNILAKFMKEMKQGMNVLTSVSTNIDESTLTQKNDSTTVGKDTLIGDQSK